MNVPAKLEQKQWSYPRKDIDQLFRRVDYGVRFWHIASYLVAFTMVAIPIVKAWALTKIPLQGKFIPQIPSSLFQL